MEHARRQAKYARIWRGRTTREKADDYQRYWLQAGAAPLRSRGALDIEMLREDHDTETEFVTISYWDSIEAMGAGPDPTRTHHLPRDAEFLVDMPDHVQILTILTPS